MPIKALMMTLAMALAAQLSMAAGPEMVAEKTVIDFGEVVQGKKVEQTFAFRNGGDSELVITQVSSSCGCTAALLSADRLPPGGKGELRAVFDSGRFRGAVSKNVSLHSNDPRRPVVEFQLRGNVRPEVELVPEHLDLGVLAPGSHREVKVTLTNRSPKELKLTARATTPEIQLSSVPATIPPGQSRSLTVKVSPAGESRGVSGYVLINALGAAVPELRLPVFAVLGSGR